MTDVELMRKRALLAVEDKDWETAATLYEQLLNNGNRDDPQLADDATNRGAVLRRLGRLQQALEHYQCWLERFPEQQNLRLNAVNCVIELGKLDLAMGWIEEGLAQSPHHVGLQQAKARALLQQGDPELARQHLEALSSKRPNEAGVWMDLALVYHRQGDSRGALHASQRASQADPQNAGAWGNQISMLRELGRLEDAQALVAALPGTVRQALAVRRAVADLWMDQQLMAEAELELRELCGLQPEEPTHWLNQAACLRQLKHFLAAGQVLKAGLRWTPNDRQLQESLGHCLAEIGKPAQGMALLRKAFPWDESLNDESHASLQFLGAGYQLLEPSERAAMARAWEKRKQADGLFPLWKDTIRRPLLGRRLRIGYLSADFCNHPVGRFLLPVIREHNRDRVEIWGLHCGPHHDEVTEKLKAQCDHWLELRFGTDFEIARMIADQNLDVLVELGGYTGFSRIGVLAFKPAPVQLSYLGFPAPTYLQSVDAWIGDSILFETLSSTDRYAHKQIKIEGGYMAYEELEQVEIEEPGKRRFRFGSFNHSRKLSRETIELFCFVLNECPDTELALKSVSFVESAERQRIKRLFVQEGIQEERILTLPWLEGRSSHLSAYKEMDVALDPLPYGGATTSCEALWMGVPVVCLSGEGMVRQLSASILYHSNCKHWISKNREEYVQISKSLANQGKRTKQLRQELRERIRSSPLGEGERLAKALEAHYQRLLKEIFTGADKDL